MDCRITSEAQMDVVMDNALAGSGQDLLSPGDPEPVTMLNKDSRSDIVLICEHAGNAIPQSLGNMGLPVETLSSHIALDIGARAVAMALANKFAAPLVMQNYSRLVYDCNRPKHASDAIVTTSDDTPIPGNQSIDDGQRTLRYREIFKPYDDALTWIFSVHPRRAAFSIHSFTRIYHGQVRPWHAGILYRKDLGTARILLEALQARLPEAVIGMNRPYDIREISDWFMTRHAERLGITHGLVEICNSLIRDPKGQDEWAGHVLAAIEAVMSRTG